MSILLTLSLALAAEPVVVPDNALVQARYDRMTSPARADWLEAAMARKRVLDPMLDAALKERDLPDDVLAVALFESGFENLEQPSTGPSAGVWQFIQRTGRTYGLTVNTRVDERLDIEKSTDAALELLSDLHTEFDDWGLAFAAYNVGSKHVNTAIEMHGTRDWIELVHAGALPNYPADVMAAVRYLDEAG